MPSMPGQVDVHQDEVGPQLANRLDGLLAGGDGADDDEPVGGLHDGGHGATERILVVDDEYADVSARDRGHGSMITGRDEAATGG